MALPFVRQDAAHDERRRELAPPDKITPHQLASPGRALEEARTLGPLRPPLSCPVRSALAPLRTPWRRKPARATLPSKGSGAALQRRDEDDWADFFRPSVRCCFL